MNRLQFPATFSLSQEHTGSQYQGKFIGRSVDTIIEESATIPTNKENFLERSSAAAFLGFSGTLEYHTEAGAKIETGKPEEAYRIMDTLYSKVRKGEFSPGNRMNQEVYVVWVFHGMKSESMQSKGMNLPANNYSSKYGSS